MLLHRKAGSFFCPLAASQGVLLRISWCRKEGSGLCSPAVPVKVLYKNLTVQEGRKWLFFYLLCEEPLIKKHFVSQE